MLLHGRVLPEYDVRFRIRGKVRNRVRVRVIDVSNGVWGRYMYSYIVSK